MVDYLVVAKVERMVDDLAVTRIERRVDKTHISNNVTSHSVILLMRM